MEQETNVVSEIIGALAFVGAYFLPIGIQIYTIYYFATNSGFLAAIASFSLPILSSIYLFVCLLIEEGLSNALTIPMVICIISYVILIKKEDTI